MLLIMTCNQCFSFLILHKGRVALQLKHLVWSLKSFRCWCRGIHSVSAPFIFDMTLKAALLKMFGLLPFSRWQLFTFRHAHERSVHGILNNQGRSCIHWTDLFASLILGALGTTTMFYMLAGHSFSGNTFWADTQDKKKITFLSNLIIWH